MFKIVIITALFACAFARPTLNLLGGGGGIHPLLAKHGLGGHGYFGYPGYYNNQFGSGLYGLKGLLASHLGLGYHLQSLGLGHKGGYGGIYGGFNGGYGGLNGGFGGGYGGLNGGFNGGSNGGFNGGSNGGFNGGSNGGLNGGYGGFNGGLNGGYGGLNGGFNGGYGIGGTVPNVIPGIVPGIVPGQSNLSPVVPNVKKVFNQVF